MKRTHVSDTPDATQEKLPPIRAKNYADNKRKSVYLVGKGLLLVVFVVLAMYGIFYTWSWSIAAGKAQTETFTELYFEDNPHLPSKVIPRHPYFFQFTLHNLEGKDMEYPYEVYTQVGQDKFLFDKGTILLKENDYKTIQERFATVAVLPRSEIVVELVNKHQQIDFWIEGGM